MFRVFRDLVESLVSLNASLDALLAAQREAGPAEDRLLELELSRAQWEADLQGLLSKAEGKLQAANNAEARERTMRKSYEKFIDPLDPDFEAEPETVQRVHAAPGQEEGLQPVRVDVAPDYRALALARKFG